MTDFNSAKPLPSSEAAIGSPNIQKETPVKRTGGRAQPKAEAKKETEKMFDITLHASDEIPPNGQHIGVNGESWLLRPGQRYQVPARVLEVLDNAVKSEPVLNDKLQVETYRDAPRITYTLHRN